MGISLRNKYQNLALNSNSNMLLKGGWEVARLTAHHPAFLHCMWVSFLITDSLQHHLLCDALRAILRPKEILNQSLITSQCFVCSEELKSAKTKPKVTSPISHGLMIFL